MWILFVGILIGWVIGVICTMAFYWAMLCEAGQKIEDGDKRYGEGTEEYRKALHALEISRDENASRRNSMIAFYNKILSLIEDHHPELVAGVKEVGEKHGYAGRNGTPLGTVPQTVES